ncbi:PREDICTED: uncharacterized protein LOC108365341 isoform X4 [Rhagoletis zephyria]|uniref:uncharacterized protein LOC108365341 isoform X4 n=1 Tax=Rhagoletis zephyria TaxID=28612 RepID=UPI0008115960|nr:PREDICTED: uncharacterized protein LOC108365341 isoform X4 [Rhagoletis zephyria]
MPIMKATADAIQPIYLNNKQICDDIIRKCSPSRRLESRELARILINPHIRNMYLKQWRANSQYHILRNSCSNFYKRDEWRMHQSIWCDFWTFLN